jgi:DNA-binding MarR family transcriptional regulator
MVAAVQTPSPYLSRGTVIAEVAQELRVHRRTIDLFEHAAAERLGVNATDAHCLEILEREGRVTAGELARGLGLTTSAVTALIDRLERAAYIARVRTPTDRRRVYVELTSHGRERAAEIWDPLEGPLHDLVASYNNHELTLIRDFLRRSRQILAERAASIRPPRPE